MFNTRDTINYLKSKISTNEITILIGLATLATSLFGSPFAEGGYFNRKAPTLDIVEEFIGRSGGTTPMIQVMFKVKNVSDTDAILDYAKVALLDANETLLPIFDPSGRITHDDESPGAGNIRVSRNGGERLLAPLSKTIPALAVICIGYRAQAQDAHKYSSFIYAADLQTPLQEFPVIRYAGAEETRSLQKRYPCPR